MPPFHWSVIVIPTQISVTVGKLMLTQQTLRLHQTVKYMHFINVVKVHGKMKHYLLVHGENVQYNSLVYT
jgi:hypothetical protein